MFAQGGGGLLLVTSLFCLAQGGALGEFWSWFCFAHGGVEFTDTFGASMLFLLAAFSGGFTVFFAHGGGVLLAYELFLKLLSAGVLLILFLTHGGWLA